MNIEARILVVDDDPKLRATIRLGLRDSGREAQMAASAEEALAQLDAADHAQGAGFDLILLDVMLPGRSGWECLQELRARGHAVPVIFLTARHEVTERVKGLRLGAEDYIVKPFAFAELLARIDVVLRRESVSDVVSVGDLCIDPKRRRVERSGVRVELSPQDLDLLQTLASRPGRVFARSELLREVWDIEFDPGTNVVNVGIARLRKRLNAHGPALIETVQGRGYRLMAPAPGDRT